LTCDFPVIIIGTADINHKFRLGAIQITKVENEANYNFFHENLQMAITALFGIE